MAAQSKLHDEPARRAEQLAVVTPFVERMIVEIERAAYRRVLALLDDNRLTHSTAARLEPFAAFAMAKATLARQLRQELLTE